MSRKWGDMTGHELAQWIAAVEAEMRAVIDGVAAAGSVGHTPGFPLYDALAYHLGWLDEAGQPLDRPAGKRLRPQLCLLCCAAAGGELSQAVPVAAAIELLHNFTLIHDDIQDRSLLRRHRPTIWARWGASQAINAGDALFAISELALLRAAARPGVAPALVLELLRAFNDTTLRIVEGQVLDLDFEARDEVSVDEYWRMIRGKTATLLAYAAWAGAVVAGADRERAEAFWAFGERLGLGFQVQDDYLGIWGQTEQTGKVSADDLRQRKKTLPVVLLLARATERDRQVLQALWRRQPPLDDEAIAVMLELLARYAIEQAMRAMVRQLHDEAQAALARAAEPGAARDALAALLSQLAERSA